MAMLNAYTLHDNKAAAYSPPFYQSNHQLAIRLVRDLVIDPTTTVGRHPSDFRLYCIGQYDDTTGRLVPAETPEHVVDAAGLVPGVEQLKPLKAVKNGRR